MDFYGHGNVHGRGVGVVGALRFVHVVVGMDWIFGPELTTKDFDSLRQTEPMIISQKLKSLLALLEELEKQLLVSKSYPVGDDFVGVHVGLSSAASLPDHQGEVVIVQRTVNHLRASKVSK